MNIRFSDDEKAEYKRLLKGKSEIHFSPDYVLLDFETTGLDPQWDEIIEIGILRVRDNNIVDTYSTLVKPESPIDPFITELTGISNEMVENAPSIKSVLPDVFSFIGSDLIVGQNVNFDYNFLYDALLLADMRPISNDLFDTMRISRKLLPDLPHHRLSDLAQYFNVENTQSHRSLSDCHTTFAVYNGLFSIAKSMSNDAYEDLFKRHYSYHNTLMNIQATTDDIDKSNPFFNKVVVFTGALEKMSRAQAAQIVVNLGGIFADSLTKKTNFLIIGNNDFCASIKDGKSNKQKKAEEYLLKGIDITVLSENVFYDMLEQ